MRYTKDVDKGWPKDFYFGAATSAHQVEGGTKNDWTEWERANADRLSQKGNRPRHNFISGKATDHYNRYLKDFDIAKDLGHNAHRFSIEWSRIEPEENNFDEKEIEHYRNVLRALRERGIEPFVTLWHWTLPLWLRELGGVRHKYFPTYFARYAKKISDELGAEIDFYITINEPEIYSLNGYLRGLWPPNKTGLLSYYMATAQLIVAHKMAYRVLKQSQPESKVGVVCNLSYFESAGGPVNALLKFFAEQLWNHHFLRHVKKETDFIGLNYYFRNRINYGFNKNPSGWTTDTRWDFFPQGIEFVLNDLRRYKKPIYITENGLADEKDEKRGLFIKETFAAISRALEKGADVRGYFHWSLLDNFEWDKGFWPRFGLIEIDYETLARKARPSALFYKKLIEAAQK